MKKLKVCCPRICSEAPTLRKKAPLLPDKYGCQGIFKPVLPVAFWLALNCTASLWGWRWWGSHLSPRLVPSCYLDLPPLFQFLFPNIFHNPSSPDFLRAHWVVGTNSKEIPVGGSVAPTIPRYPFSRISPSALRWWKKKSTTSIRIQDGWIHSCSVLVRDGPWNLTVCILSGRSLATQVL